MKFDKLFYSTDVPAVNEFFGGFERSATTSVYADPASGKSIIAMQAAFDHVRLHKESALYIFCDPNIGYADIYYFWQRYNAKHKKEIRLYGAIYNPSKQDIADLDPDIVFEMEEYTKPPSKKPRYRLVFKQRNEVESPCVVAMKVADPIDVLMLYGVPMNIEKSEKGMLTARYQQQDVDDTRVVSPLDCTLYEFIKQYGVQFLVLDSISEILGLFELGGRVNLMARFEAAQALMMRMNTVNAAMNAAIFAIVHAGGDPSTGSVTLKGGAAVKFSTKATFRILNKSEWNSKKRFIDYRLAQRMRQNWSADGSAAMWIKFADVGFEPAKGTIPAYKPDEIQQMFGECAVETSKGETSE